MDEIAFLTKGAKVAAVQLCQTCAPQEYTAKYSFAFMSSARPLFQSIAQARLYPRSLCAHQIQALPGEDHIPHLCSSNDRRTFASQHSSSCKRCQTA
jgi:hypothetical protein